MVVRPAPPGSSLPSTEINLTSGGAKIKYPHYIPQSPRQNVSRHSTPVSQRPSPGRPRLSVSTASKLNAKDERRDDLNSHDEGETVCDYDTNATMLYELLESSAWDRARARCRSHPEEVRTWIIRKDKSLSVRWKLLPLHAAIIFQSPNFLVSAIIDQYPAAVSKVDDQGMLPLHLAFRHKQEDEDLLELLLLKYPKAVMIKDRRDRVPLEHGRESKFSAKVMRLYADAVTAASRLVGGKGGGIPTTPTTMLSNSSMTVGERAVIMKDHREEITALKMKHETQLRKVKNVAGEQMHQIEEKARKQIEEIRADYEAQIRDMKDAHERRLATMRQSHQSNISHVEQAADEEKKELMEQHVKELNELRILLDSQVNQDRQLAYGLEKEVAHLQVALQERRTVHEQTAKRNDALEEENKKLRDVLTHIQSHQVTLNEMLTRQNEEIQASRLIRNQLVQSLQRQDDNDRNTQVILEVADKIRRKVTTSLIEITQQHTLERQLSPRTRPPTEESRIERDRNELLRNENVTKNRLEQARTKDNVVDKRTMISKSHEDFDVTSPNNTTSEYYGEVKILADEISAMTDCSEY